MKSARKMNWEILLQIDSETMHVWGVMNIKR